MLSQLVPQRTGFLTRIVELCAQCHVLLHNFSQRQLGEPKRVAHRIMNVQLRETEKMFIDVCDGRQNFDDQYTQRQIRRQAVQCSASHDRPQLSSKFCFFRPDEGIQLIQFHDLAGGRLRWRGRKGAMMRFEEACNASQSIPFQIECEGLLAFGRSITAWVGSGRPIAPTRFALIALAAAGIASGFD
jgi:hypothetical protein